MAAPAIRLCARPAAAFSLALGVAILLAFPGYIFCLTSRPVVATPETSFRRTAEGYRLKQGSRYTETGSMYHGSSLLLPTLGSMALRRQQGGRQLHARTRVPLDVDLLQSSVASLKSCEDLNGVGSFDTTCLFDSDLELDDDLYVYGVGNVELSPHAKIVCPVNGCTVSINVSGSIKVGQYSQIIAGTIQLHAMEITLHQLSAINTTALAGTPPPQTTGTPHGLDGSGGGHGGRGASCRISNITNWGGDVYSWDSLSMPWSYGSKGGTISPVEQFGGDGGGRVMLQAQKSLLVDGHVLAEGGIGSLKGGGGSGGSIIIRSVKLTGNGSISAAGGSGWGGGGGGRISLDCYSIQSELIITAHGGLSSGCPNAGAAGTIYDVSLETLKVSNNNFSTHTETPLLGFPTRRLWSNVLVECNAKLLVPLLWSRVQVTGQIRILSGGSICFGLAANPISEFELVAEELLMSDSIVKVYGAFRMYVKVLLMWDSEVQIDGGGRSDVRMSMLEVRNLVVLRHNSTISSNAVLGLYGQGLLNLSGDGDGIKAQRLFLSLFYNINVGSGSFLRAPQDDGHAISLDPQSTCESQKCPNELIMPPDDCHVNSSMSFTLQICRVDDIKVSGLIRGGIIHIHRTRTLNIDKDGSISASELGCTEGIGKGKFLNYGVGGGAGHGGKGGSGFYNGVLVEGGREYGDPDLPCELGSGGGGSDGLPSAVAGGGLIVLGSIKWPLSQLKIYGSLSADGQSHGSLARKFDGIISGGVGGGSGGTILLFLNSLVLHKNSTLSVSGGNGGPNGGGGGGGGRIHFHWSDIASGDEYVQIAIVNGTMQSSGGIGNGGGYPGEDGSITGKQCPKGLYGTFCHECPVGTYKDVAGSSFSLCFPCPLDALPQRADFIYVRGGVTKPFCPYQCISEKYSMPNCYTPLEELIYTFGGPWLFALLLFTVLILLALLISALRIKVVGGDLSYRSGNAIHTDVSESFPFLLSLAEVPGTSRVEDTQSHVHRLYFMGPNTFREPWHLPYSPPEAIIRIVYEDAFNRFIDDINLVAAYEWWEGSIYGILMVLAYPCAWSWKQWRRRKKIHRLQEYVKSEYDHSCLRSCRSRALYKGMKVGSTADLMVSYIDFFLGGDEKRLDVVSTIQKRFPMCIIFGGNGSFMSPFYLHSDSLLTNLLGQYVSTAIWNRLVAGLNAQLRTVRPGTIRSSLHPAIAWLNSHGNPQLEHHGVRIELGWFQATASGYYQLGVVVAVNEHFYKNDLPNNSNDSGEFSRRTYDFGVPRQNSNQSTQNLLSTSHATSKKRLTGGVSGRIVNEATLNSLDVRRDYLFPISLLLQNVRPIGFPETVQLLICIMLLGDIAITLLMLLQFYWISVASFLLILLIPPLSSLSPFLAGLNSLFSRGPKRSTLSRIYALWNSASIVNIMVAITCGTLYSCLGLVFSGATRTTREGNEWWVLPIILLLVKILQAGLISWHIANVEIPDLSLYSTNPDRFWAM